MAPVRANILSGKHGLSPASYSAAAAGAAKRQEVSGDIGADILAAVQALSNKVEGIRGDLGDLKASMDAVKGQLGQLEQRQQQTEEQQQRLGTQVESLIVNATAEFNKLWGTINGIEAWRVTQQYGWETFKQRSQVQRAVGVFDKIEGWADMSEQDRRQAVKMTLQQAYSEAGVAAVDLEVVHALVPKTLPSGKVLPGVVVFKLPPQLVQQCALDSKVKVALRSQGILIRVDLRPEERANIAALKASAEYRQAQREAEGRGVGAMWRLDACCFGRRWGEGGILQAPVGSAAPPAAAGARMDTA